MIAMSALRDIAYDIGQRGKEAADDAASRDTPAAKAPDMIFCPR